MDWGMFQIGEVVDGPPGRWRTQGMKAECVLFELRLV